MLPDIKKPSGIRKTVQVKFGGIDLRPEAGDGTFAKTVNMSSDKAPVMASRPKRQAVYQDQGVICSMVRINGGLFLIRDGEMFFNNVKIGDASIQGEEHPVVFGSRIILPKSRESVDLSVPPKGHKASEAELPDSAAEGDAWLLPNQSESVYDPDELWVRISGEWVNTGPIIKSLEEESYIGVAVFRSGTYQGEAAANNTIEWYNHAEMVSGEDSQGFLKHFKVGDAVTIDAGLFTEFNQTLIVREVTATQLRFYENSFQNLVGRFTVPARDEEGNAGSVGPGLYEVTGWDRFEVPIGEEDPLKYFVIPSGTTLTPGMYIEYRFQDAQFNSENTHHNEAEIKIFQADGTELTGVTVTLLNSYSSATYPEGPKELRFETVDCGEDLCFGVLSVTIKKKWPEGLEGVFTDSNRLWGWVGHQIRCSKLGDPSNWDFFDGTAEDSWAVDVHDPDAFTGGISVHGYPTFYTERKRYRIYGSEPEAYQLGEQDCEGVRAGCGKSMVTFDGALYYVSPVGVMQDTGSAPACVSEALGLMRLHDAVAGGHQKRYYVSGMDEAGTWHNLVLDTRNGLWIDEGSRFVECYASAGVMHEVMVEGVWLNNMTIWAYGAGSPLGSGTEEGAISSVLETNDYTMAYPNRKRVHRVQLRFVIGSGASLAVAIQYDGDGTWVPVKEIAGDGKKRSMYLPVIPRRCDHFRLRFSGSGEWELFSLALDLRQGSAAF